MSTGTIPYAFHSAPHVPEQLAHLQHCLDPITIEALEQLGVDAGWRCLEVGAGSGSIATWLAGRVGAAGHVTATDLDRDRLPVVDGMTVLRHDISRDPVPSGEWDLIHARLVLQHLPDRRHVVAKLSGALRPGGWLLLEDFDCRHLPAAVAPSEADATLFARVTRAILVVLERAGADLGWGVHAYGAMRAAGLVDVAAQLRSQIWAGGTPGCLLHLTNSRQLARPLQEAGLDAGTLDRFRALMRDPAFAASFYLMVSTRGRRDREGR